MTLFLYAYTHDNLMKRRELWQTVLYSFYILVIACIMLMLYHWDTIQAWHDNALIMMIVLDATVALTFWSVWSYIFETLKEFLPISEIQHDQLKRYGQEYPSIQRYLREVTKKRPLYAYDYHRCMYYTLFYK